MSDNAFTGEIPWNLWSLTQLETVVLARNGFTGGLLATVGNLDKLS